MRNHSAIVDRRCTDIEANSVSATNRNVGIDLGIKDFAITSDGDSYLLGKSFWEHDPNFDLAIPKKLNGIENADVIYGDVNKFLLLRWQ